MTKDDIMRRIREALLKYDSEETERTAREALQEGVAPSKVLDNLTSTAREIGEMFGRSEIFLADLMMASEALKAGMDVVVAKLPKGENATLGTVVLGTVKGDIHEIGKRIVGTMLIAGGFQVYDIGEDKAPSEFGEAAERFRADVVGASALMSTTTPVLGEIVEYCRAGGVKHIIVVGGGAVTSDYAHNIGADGYAPDGTSATELVRKLLARS